MYFIRVVKGTQLELYVFEKAKYCRLGELCWNWNERKYLCTILKARKLKACGWFPVTLSIDLLYFTALRSKFTELEWSFLPLYRFLSQNKIRVCSCFEVVLEWVVISLCEYPEQLSITTKLRRSLNKIVLSIKIKQQRTPGQLIRPFDLSRNRKFLAIYVFPNCRTLKKWCGTR